MANVLMLSYFAYKVYGMVNHDHNDVNHTELSRDAASLFEKYKYNDMDSSVFFALSNDTHYFTLEEFGQYVSIEYSQKKSDYGKNQFEVYNTQNFEPCTEQDFSVDEKSLDYYKNSYSNFPIFCIHPTSDVYLEGTDSTSYRKTIYVTVKKCQESSRVKCKSDQEIIKFVNRLHVNVYSITEKVDFKKFNAKPVYSKIKKEFEVYSKASSQNVVILNLR